MNEQEVRELIGDDNWDDFLEFMTGQTVGVSKDGLLIFYKHDVERYHYGKKIRNGSNPRF